MNFPTRSPSPLPTATPTQYVVLHNIQHCAHCGTMHEHTTIMLKGTLPARMGDISGAKVIQMTTLKGAPLYNLPIIHMSRPLEYIPFCHECLGSNTDGTTSVSHLPPPAITDTRILAAARSPEAGQSPKASTHKKIKSVDDILSQL